MRVMGKGWTNEIAHRAIMHAVIAPPCLDLREGRALRLAKG